MGEEVESVDLAESVSNSSDSDGDDEEEEEVVVEEEEEVAHCLLSHGMPAPLPKRSIRRAESIASPTSHFYALRLVSMRVAKRTRGLKITEL